MPGHIWLHTTLEDPWPKLHDFGGVLGWRSLNTFFWALVISRTQFLARVWSGPNILLIALEQYFGSYWLRGWSHWPPSINISDCNSVENGELASIYEYNPRNFTAGTKRKVWCDRGMRGWSHRPVRTPYGDISGYVIVWEVVGQHLFKNMSPQNFTAGTERIVWCDWGMWDWSHQQVRTPSIGISGYVIVWKVVGQHLFMNINPNNFTTGTRRGIWCDQGMRPDSTSNSRCALNGHGNKFEHHQVQTLSIGISDYVIVWKMMDQHLFMNIIPNNFTAETGRGVWCDWGMRPDSTPNSRCALNDPGASSNTIYQHLWLCNRMKNDGPTSIYEHNPQQFHDWNWTGSLVWPGHEAGLHTQ